MILNNIWFYTIYEIGHYMICTCLEHVRNISVYLIINFLLCLNLIENKSSNKFACISPCTFVKLMIMSCINKTAELKWTKYNKYKIKLSKINVIRLPYI